MDTAVKQLSRRFAYRIGDKLPKLLKIMYYIVLFVTFIYILYRFFEWTLVTFQKIGEFFFRKQNYWAAVVSIIVVLIGTFLVSQFILGLDPVGHVIGKIQDFIRMLEMRYL